MGILATLKKINRMLLELETGTLFVGMLCQIAGCFFVKEKGMYALSLWVGVLLAMLAQVHMYRILDRALDCGESEAVKQIVNGQRLRYALLTVFIGVIILTKPLNPLVVFLGCMTLKVAAFIQPFTHKVYNAVFRETDPIPQALLEETPGDGQEKAPALPGENE